MRRTQRITEPLAELVERLVPCCAAYWSPHGQRLCDAAKAGLCQMKIVGYPYWEFTKNPAPPAQEEA